MTIDSALLSNPTTAAKDINRVLSASYQIQKTSIY